MGLDSAVSMGHFLPLINFKVGEMDFIELVYSGARVNLINFKTAKSPLENKLVKDIDNCFLKISGVTGDNAITTNYVHVKLNMEIKIVKIRFYVKQF